MKHDNLMPPMAEVLKAPQDRFGIVKQIAQYNKKAAPLNAFSQIVKRICQVGFWFMIGLLQHVEQNPHVRAGTAWLNELAHAGIEYRGKPHAIALAN